jgi:branched-chain amino acid transport system permease protein
MTLFIAQIINGLILGGIYALLVTGFNLLLLEGGIFQYAYPHLLILSMYCCWWVLGITNNNLFLGVTAAVVSGVVLGILTEPIFRTLSKRRAAIASFIVSLGMAIVITDILYRKSQMGLIIAFPESLKGETAIIQFGLAILTAGQIVTIAGSIIVTGGLFLFLYKTKMGRAMRAMAQNPNVVRLMGLPVRKMSLLSYTFAGLLGGISSVFLIMALGSAQAGFGNILALKVLAAAIFAGLGNLGGGLVAALILGLSESFVMGYLQGDWAPAVSLGMIMIVVMFKPQGIFGSKV